MECCPNCEGRRPEQPTPQTNAQEKLICSILGIPDRAPFGFKWRLFNLAFTDRRLVGWVALKESEIRSIKSESDSEPKDEDDGKPLGTYFAPSHFDRMIEFDPKANYGYEYSILKSIKLHKLSFPSSISYPAQINIELFDGLKKKYGLRSDDYDALKFNLQKIPTLLPRVRF